MWTKIKLELMALGVVFLVFFVSCGVVLVIPVFLIVPIGNWWKFGVLHFPIGWFELCKFLGLIFSLSIIGTLLVWFGGKFTKHN